MTIVGRLKLTLGEFLKGRQQKESEKTLTEKVIRKKERSAMTVSL